MNMYLRNIVYTIMDIVEALFFIMYLLQENEQ